MLSLSAAQVWYRLPTSPESASKLANHDYARKCGDWRAAPSGIFWKPAEIGGIDERDVSRKIERSTAAARACRYERRSNLLLDSR